MKINIKDLNFTITVKNGLEFPDLLAEVSLIFRDEHERHFTCNGFTIRKSKYNNKPYLTFPSKKTSSGFYKYNLVEKSLFKEIEREALKQYEKEIIPIINE